MDSQFQQTMQVGVWAPTQRISKRNSTGNASWGVGPNTENFEKKFYRQCELGWDDEINFTKISFLSHSHGAN
ncbi:hypothetical protein BGC44_14125 [Staphylococcus aureus]|nr:hypothetical protein BGC44_14125 [Staphylococcus aureus]